MCEGLNSWWWNESRVCWGQSGQWKITLLRWFWWYLTCSILWSGSFGNNVKGQTTSSAGVIITNIFPNCSVQVLVWKPGCVHPSPADPAEAGFSITGAVWQWGQHHTHPTGCVQGSRAAPWVRELWRHPTDRPTHVAGLLWRWGNRKTSHPFFFLWTLQNFKATSFVCTVSILRRISF